MFKKSSISVLSIVTLNKKVIEKFNEMGCVFMVISLILHTSIIWLWKDIILVYIHGPIRPEIVPILAYIKT